MTVGAPTYPNVQRPHYDRNFEPAIREGLLSVQEAVRRGNRQAYAEQLGRRYYLSTELAFEVTDNRTRLFDVLQKTGQIPGHPAPRRERRGLALQSRSPREANRRVKETVERTGQGNR